MRQRAFASCLRGSSKRGQADCQSAAGYQPVINLPHISDWVSWWFAYTSVRIRFLTSTPLDIRRGSGTYVGISVLAKALTELGHTVAFEGPKLHLPVYTLERLWFNRGLRPSDAYDLTVGFDMDGYRIARGGSHVASLKGVIADEVRFETGLTRLTMSVQARCERLHVHRAARVLVTSKYSSVPFFRASSRL